MKIISEEIKYSEKDVTDDFKRYIKNGFDFNKNGNIIGSNTKKLNSYLDSFKKARRKMNKHMIDIHIEYEVNYVGPPHNYEIKIIEVIEYE